MDQRYADQFRFDHRGQRKSGEIDLDNRPFRPDSQLTEAEWAEWEASRRSEPE